MAYTVLASWDFRGADSAATKRVARIGGYTLTEGGTITWTSDGADCSGAAANKLTLTMPAELKVSPVWWVCGMRLMSGTAPADYTTVCGLLQNAGNEYEASMLAYRLPNTSTNLRIGQSGSYGDVGGGSALSTGSDTILAARRTGTNNPAFGLRVNNDAWDTGIIDGNPVDYAATSQVFMGSIGAQNSLMRYHWFVMGSGAISDAEVQAIYDNPDAFIYPAPSGVSSAGTIAHLLNN